MKVNIPKPKSFFGPYQLVERVFFFVPRGKDECGMRRHPDWMHELGGKLASNKNGDDSLLLRFFVWLDKKRLAMHKRRTKIVIHPYDTWSADHTLGMIILPTLVLLKKKKQSAPHVDDEDVPEELKSTSAPPLKNSWETDENWFKRWDWVMDEMIWAFENHLDYDADSKFYDHSDVDTKSAMGAPACAMKVDREGLRAWEDRKQNGFRLFGKYYQGLWS